VSERLIKLLERLKDFPAEVNVALAKPLREIGDE
jgi:hypothetical protein